MTYSLSRTASIRTKEFFGHGTPIVNYMDVFQHPAIYSSMLTGRVSLTNQELSTFDVRMGDVFFTRTSETTDEVGIASVVLDEPSQTVFSGFLLRARPKNNKLCNEFKRYLLCTQLRAQTDNFSGFIHHTRPYERQDTFGSNPSHPRIRGATCNRRSLE